MTRYVRPRGVAMMTDDAHDEGEVAVYLAPLPDGPLQVLNGVASVIWLEATAYDTSLDVVQRVADVVGRPADDIRPTVEAFLIDLVEAGLLERLDDELD